MVTFNTTTTDAKEATRQAAITFARQIATIQAEMFRLIADEAPQELVQMVHHTLMDTAVDVFVSRHTLVLDGEESRIPVPSCN